MSSNAIFVIGTGLFLCALGLVVANYVFRAAEKRKDERRASTRKKELDAFYTSALQPLANVDIAVADNEVFYYAGVAEWEARAKGARRQEIVRMPGILYLSNQRLCFIGALGADERMAFGAWEQATIHPSLIELRFHDENAIFIFSDDPMLGPIFGRLTKRQFAPLHS